MKFNKLRWESLPCGDAIDPVRFIAPPRPSRGAQADVMNVVATEWDDQHNFLLCMSASDSSLLACLDVFPNAMIIDKTAMVGQVTGAV